MKFKEGIELAVAVIVCELLGSIGAIFTMMSIWTWYALLRKPSFTPPDAVFAPVWTLLFALMGIAVFLVWQRRKQIDVRWPLVAFGLQLCLNVAWSVVFFGMRNIAGGFVDIVALWCMILGTIIIFWRDSRPAAWLLMPYLAWVTFAMFLNYQLLVLN